jgi:hypothetical protein
MRWGLIDRFGISFLNDATQIHNGDAITNMTDNTEIMTDEEQSQIEFVAQRQKQV